MEIKYLGRSSFRLKGEGVTVITDPFNPDKVGLAYPKTNAEIVTVSHQHDDHNFTERVGGTEKRPEPLVIDRPGEYEAGGVSIIGVRSWHDDKQGEERGENVIFVMQIEGVIVCHLGDLGHTLSDKQVAAIGQIDVLLVPVGGFYTIGPDVADKVIASLSPSIVVPMHYVVPGMKDDSGQMVGVEQFLEKMGMSEAKKEDKLKITKATLPEEMEVVVLNI